MSAEEEQLTCFCRALESRMVNKQFRTRCRRSSIIIRRCAVRIIMEPNSRWLENFQDLFEIVTFYRPSGRYLYGTKQNYWIMMCMIKMFFRTRTHALFSSVSHVKFHVAVSSDAQQGGGELKIQTPNKTSCGENISKPQLNYFIENRSYCIGVLVRQPLIHRRTT